MDHSEPHAVPGGLLGVVPSKSARPPPKHSAPKAPPMSHPKALVLAGHGAEAQQPAGAAKAPPFKAPPPGVKAPPFKAPPPGVKAPPFKAPPPPPGVKAPPPAGGVLDDGMSLGSNATPQRSISPIEINLPHSGSSTPQAMIGSPTTATTTTTGAAAEGVPPHGPPPVANGPSAPGAAAPPKMISGEGSAAPPKGPPRGSNPLPLPPTTTSSSSSPPSPPLPVTNGPGGASPNPPAAPRAPDGSAEAEEEEDRRRELARAQADEDAARERFEAALLRSHLAASDPAPAHERVLEAFPPRAAEAAGAPGAATSAVGRGPEPAAPSEIEISIVPLGGTESSSLGNVSWSADAARARIQELEGARRNDAVHGTSIASPPPPPPPPSQQMFQGHTTPGRQPWLHMEPLSPPSAHHHHPRPVPPPPTPAAAPTHYGAQLHVPAATPSTDVSRRLEEIERELLELQSARRESEARLMDSVIASSVAPTVPPSSRISVGHASPPHTPGAAYLPRRNRSPPSSDDGCLRSLHATPRQQRCPLHLEQLYRAPSPTRPEAANFHLQPHTSRYGDSVGSVETKREWGGGARTFSYGAAAAAAGGGSSSSSFGPGRQSPPPPPPPTVQSYSPGPSTWHTGPFAFGAAAAAPSGLLSSPPRVRVAASRAYTTDPSVSPAAAAAFAKLRAPSPGAWR